VIVLGGELLSNFNAFLAFTVAGLVSLLSNLFVHLASDFSLFKISLSKMSKRVGWLTLSIEAILFSCFELFQSISKSSPVIVYFFMGSIILGFLAAEVMEMSKAEDKAEDRGGESTHSQAEV